MPLKSSRPTYLDQPFCQSIGRFPRQHTVWQWAEHLRPVSLTRPLVVPGGEGVPPEVDRKTASLDKVPMRKAQVGGVLTPGAATIKTNAKYDTIKGLLQKPFGEFSASRFFLYPGTVNTQAVATIVNAVGSNIDGQPDEAPFLRCAFILELCASPATVQRATQLPSRCAVTYTARDTRKGCLSVRADGTGWPGTCGRPDRVRAASRGRQPSPAQCSRSFSRATTVFRPVSVHAFRRTRGRRRPLWLQSLAACRGRP